jgi:hypothetical protein
MGHPISHSTHSGFSWPPSEAMTAWSIRSLTRLFPLLRVSAAGEEPLLAHALGVGHVRADTASISVPPSRPLRGVIRPPFAPRLAVGVGQSAGVFTCWARLLPVIASVIVPPRRASDALGVVHCFAALERPHPAFLLAPGWL